MAELICWAPECSNGVPQTPNRRPKLYCSAACKQRAFRRNGMQAPSEPYPPLEIGATLHQAAPAVTVVPKQSERRSDAAGKARKARRDSVQPPVVPETAVKRKAHATTGKPAPSVTPPGGAEASRPSVAAAIGPTASAPQQAPGSEAGGPVVGSAPEPGQGVAASADHLNAEAAAPGSAELTVTIPVDAKLPPVPLVEHPMVTAYKADLAKLGQLDTRQGQKVIEMATKLTSSATSAAASATLSKELDRAMDELTKAAGTASEQDPFNVIRQRTLHKLGLVGAR